MFIIINIVTEIWIEPKQEIGAVPMQTWRDYPRNKTNGSYSIMLGREQCFIFCQTQSRVDTLDRYTIDTTTCDRIVLCTLCIYWRWQWFKVFVWEQSLVSHFAVRTWYFFVMTKIDSYVFFFFIFSVLNECHRECV